MTGERALVAIELARVGLENAARDQAQVSGLMLDLMGERVGRGRGVVPVLVEADAEDKEADTAREDATADGGSRDVLGGSRDVLGRSRRVNASSSTTNLDCTFTSGSTSRTDNDGMRRLFTWQDLLVSGFVDSAHDGNVNPVIRYDYNHNVVMLTYQWEDIALPTPSRHTRFVESVGNPTTASVAFADVGPVVDEVWNKTQMLGNPTTIRDGAWSSFDVGEGQAHCVTVYEVNGVIKGKWSPDGHTWFPSVNPVTADVLK